MSETLHLLSFPQAVVCAPPHKLALPLCKWPFSGIGEGCCKATEERSDEQSDGGAELGAKRWRGCATILTDITWGIAYVAHVPTWAIFVFMKKDILVFYTICLEVIFEVFFGLEIAPTTII